MSQPVADGNSVVVKIFRLPGNEDVPLPSRQTEHASGFDVCAAVTGPVVIEPGAIVTVPGGFAMAIPVGWEAQMRPRSGLSSKSGIGMPNSPGTIDADYRGEVRIPLINYSKVAFTVTRGMRIGQMVIQRVPMVVLEEVASLEALGETGRGAKGFGSTGH